MVAAADVVDGDAETFVAGGENELTSNGDVETWIDGDASLGTLMMLSDSYCCCLAMSQYCIHAVVADGDEPQVRQQQVAKHAVAAVVERERLKLLIHFH